MYKHVLFLLIVSLLAACGQERAPIASSVAPAGDSVAQAQPSLAQDAETCVDKAKINRNAMCTMDYRPVCGCDNQTYSNACHAANAGLLSWTEGECPTTH